MSRRLLSSNGDGATLLKLAKVGRASGSLGTRAYLLLSDGDDDNDVVVTAGVSTLMSCDWWSSDVVVVVASSMNVIPCVRVCVSEYDNDGDE